MFPPLSLEVESPLWWQVINRGAAMMGRYVLAGVLAALAGGVVFGLMMQFMTAPAPDDGRVPMMQMVANVVRSDNLAVGWIYHLFNSAVLGAIFGLLAGDRLGSYAIAVGDGAIYGLVWWVLGALILMPVFLGMAPFAPLIMATMVPVALGSLVGHLIYGVILGAGYLAILAPRTPTLVLRR
jgi:hypothetical protein